MPAPDVPGRSGRTERVDTVLKPGLATDAQMIGAASTRGVSNR
jgi:hypothetical protein